MKTVKKKNEEELRKSRNEMRVKYNGSEKWWARAITDEANDVQVNRRTIGLQNVARRKFFWWCQCVAGG